MRSCTILGLTLAALLAGTAASAQEPATPAPAPQQEPACEIPEEAVKAKNPVKAESGSIRQGRHLFETQCALCHGKAGDGKGDMVEPMGLKIKDYRDPAALKDVSDGALFYVLEKGCGKMPGEEGRMKANQMWNLVNFIRSLARKETAEQKEAPQR